MSLRCERTAIPGVLLFTPAVHGDARGFFLQTYHARQYAEAGLDRVFVQDNLSRSCRDTVRGLHYQLRHPQAKLVGVLRGAVLDVALDVRRNSPFFGQCVVAELTEENRQQLFIPEGFAHGFRVLSDAADVFYKCTDYYAPGDEFGVRWDDPELGIPWGDVAAPIVSERDRNQPLLADMPAAHLPDFAP